MLHPVWSLHLRCRGLPGDRRPSSVRADDDRRPSAGVPAAAARPRRRQPRRPRRHPAATALSRRRTRLGLYTSSECINETSVTQAVLLYKASIEEQGTENTSYGTRTLYSSIQTYVRTVSIVT